MSDATTGHGGEANAGLTNREFLRLHARAGCIGLCGGVGLIDFAISRAERHLDDDHKWAIWTHAFIIQGERPDGQHWVLESDLQIHRRHIRLGVQENRLSKYHNEKLYSALAILDFGLTPAQVKALLREGLELVANRERYSIRELFGTLMGLRDPEKRGGDNPLAKNRSIFCSALVRHLFLQAGVDLAPGVGGKHTTPEDLWRTPVPHARQILHRKSAPAKIDAAKEKVANLRKKLRQGVRAPFRGLRRSKRTPADG